MKDHPSNKYTASGASIGSVEYLIGFAGQFSGADPGY